MSENQFDEHLPNSFNIDYYEFLKNELSVNEWGYQFAIRKFESENITEYGLEQKTKGIERVLEVVNGTNPFTPFYNDFVGSHGLSYSNPTKKFFSLKGPWQNGVYQQHSISRINLYIDKHRINKLDELGILESIGNKEDFKNHPVKSLDQGNFLGFCGPLGDGALTYLHSRDQDSLDEYEKFIQSLEYDHAAFLLNIDMPINVLLDEIKNRLISLKKARNKIENKKDYRNKFENWAIGLACYDLTKLGIKPKTICHRYISWVLDGEKSSLDIPLDNSLYREYEKRIKQVTKFIKGGWKKLPGDPLI